MNKIIIFTFVLLVQSVCYAGSPYPVRGMSMQEVIQQQGEPQSRKGPIGNPPISRWIYQDFSVYFEAGTVIHSVKNNKKSIY